MDVYVLGLYRVLDNHGAICFVTLTLAFLLFPLSNTSFQWIFMAFAEDNTKQKWHHTNNPRYTRLEDVWRF